MYVIAQIEKLDPDTGKPVTPTELAEVGAEGVTTARVLVDDEPAVRAALGDLQARVGSAAATLDERMAMLR